MTAFTTVAASSVGSVVKQYRFFPLLYSEKLMSFVVKKKIRVTQHVKSGTETPAQVKSVPQSSCY